MDMTTPKRNEAVARYVLVIDSNVVRIERRDDGEWISYADHVGALDALQGEVSRLRAIIDTPQSNDFLRAVRTEAEHQRQRWGSDHDAGKQPADWFWLVGYLAGKALHAHAAGNVEKAEHHIITTAAALANWHLSMFGGTDMRPGIDGDAALNLEPPTDGR